MLQVFHEQVWEVGADGPRARDTERVRAVPMRIHAGNRVTQAIPTCESEMELPRMHSAQPARASVQMSG
jgi:hypothetical protein